jgi:hypothetical protein
MKIANAGAVAMAIVAVLGVLHPIQAGTLAFGYTQSPLPPGIGPAIPYSAEGEYGDDLKWSAKDGPHAELSFSYHSNYDQAIGMTVRLYDQDGPKVSGKPSPGTLLLMEQIDVRKGGGEVNLDLGADFWAKAPSQLVFTVNFGKMADGHQAGLYAAGGPLGDQYRDTKYWQRDCPDGGEWNLVKFEGLKTAAAEFVTVMRVTHLPEPSTWALAGVGAAGILLAGWRGKAKRAACVHGVDASARS